VTLRSAILGAPGAGKGTQAQRVCERLHLAHLSTGDLLRSAVAAGTAAGKQAKSHMDAGRLVPDDVVFRVLFERLDRSTGGFLLDGFPRNRAQAEELDRRLASQRVALDVVVDIEVPDSRLAARLTGRRSCGSCGRSFHLEFFPPAVADVCDDCGGALKHRADDTLAVVGQRLAVYHEQTAPLVDYYERAGILVRVDGDQDVERVTAEVLDALQNDVPERA